MKKLFKSTLNFFAAALSASLLFNFISCEVGLGATVDVEKPTVSITYPPVSSIVRDSFMLAGTCSDDRELKSIEVEIQNSDGKVVFDSVYDDIITLSGDGTSKNATWCVEINKSADGKYPLADGKYIFNVTSNDASGRKSAISTRALEIDNTAPVFIIQSPGSIDSSKAYGSILKVTGNIAEDHKVSYMKLVMYDENGKDITTIYDGTDTEWLEKDIDTSGTSNVTFARFSESIGDILHNRYAEIYGSQSRGVVNYSASLVLGDNAGVYKTPVYEDTEASSDDSGEEFSGNYTSSLWLNDSINGDDAAENNLLGKNSIKYHKRQYEIGDLLKILNGTYTKKSTESENDIKTVYSVLESCKIDTLEYTLPVTLNKDANPTYEFSGYSFTENTTKNVAYKSGTVNVKADYGLDATQFSPATIKVYLFGPYTADEFTEELISSIYDDVSGYAAKELAKTDRGENGLAYVLYDASGDSKTSVDTWQKAITLPDSLNSKKKYLFALTGNDTDGVSFLPANGYYGFEAKSTGSAPVVSITTPETDFVAGDNSALVISGTASATDNGDPVTGVSYSVTVTDVLNSNKILGTVTGSAESTEGVIGVDSEISWSFYISEGTWKAAADVTATSPVPAEGSVYKYAVKVTATTESEGTDQTAFQIDRKKPEVTIASVSPYAKEETIEGVTYYYVNGEIRITCDISDTNLDDSNLIITDETGYSQELPLLDSTYVQRDINTTAGFSPKSKITITLTSKDKAGNENSVSETHYIIDQDTDKPVITLSNADKLMDSALKISSTPEGSYGNLFDQSLSNKILGNLSDDDKIASYKIEYTTDITSAADEISEESWVTLDEGSKVNSSTKNLETELKKKSGLTKEALPEGVYRIRISVTDEKNSDFDKTPSVTSVTDPFFIAIDAASPTVLISNAQNEWYSAGETRVISGTAIDASGYVHIVRDGTVDIPVTDGTWTDTITVAEESTTISYIAYDKYNKSTEITYSYKVDDADPVVEITSPADSSIYIGATLSTVRSFAGTAKDDNGSENGKSGVSKVQYRIGNGEWTDLTGTTQWNGNINFGSTAGTYTVQFKAIDNSGRESAVLSKTVIVDAESPVISDEKVTDLDGNVIAPDLNNYYVNSAFVISGKITDSNPDTVTVGNADAEIYGEKFTYTVTNSESKNYVITAMDKAGQTSAKSISVVYDIVPPAPQFNVGALISANGKENNVNGTITISGTATDNDKVVKTEVVIYRKDGSDEPFTLGTYEGDNAASFSLTGDTSYIDDKSEYVVKVISTDRAGNSAFTTKDIYVDQSTDKPVVSLSNADDTVTSEEGVTEAVNLFGYTSNNKILGTVSDDDSISSVQVLCLVGTEWIPIKSVENINKSTYSLSAELAYGGNPLAENIYQVKIIVTDVKTDESPAAVTTVGPFYIAVDAADPTLTVTSTPNEWYSAGETRVISGTAYDASGVVRVVRNSTENITVSADGTWSDSITVADSSTTVSYKAYDKYNKSTELTFSYLVDDADPSIVISSPSADEYLGGASGNSTKAFSGTASDLSGTGKSGVKEILYRVITHNSDGTDSYSAGNATAPDYDSWLKASGTTTWNVNVELGRVSAVKEVQFVSVDNSGRHSAATSRTITVDGAAPVINITKLEDSLDAAARTVTQQDGTYFVKSAYKITGSITEEHLASLTNKSDNSEITVNDDGSFTLNVTNPASGQHTITLEAVDEALQSFFLNINVYYDITDPTPNISVSPIVIANGKENNVNGSVSLKATAVDDDKLVKSHFRIIDLDADNEVVVETDTASPSTINRSISLTDCIAGTTVGGLYTIAPGKIKDQNNYRVELTSTDRAGRTGTAFINVYLDQSTDKPIVTLSNTDAAASSASAVTKEKNLFNQTSNNKILGTITDDDGIASILVEYAVITNGTAGTYQTLTSYENCGTTYSLSTELKKNGTALAEGKYKIRITVLDITETSENHKTVDEFFIGIDNGAPGITVTTAADGWQTATFTATGTALDASLSKISRYYTKVEDGNRVKDGEPVIWSVNGNDNHITYNSETNGWSDAYSVSEGKIVMYVAEDEYGQTTEVLWSFRYDVDVPTKAPDWTAQDMSAWTKNSARQFKIPVSDYWNVTAGTRYDSCAGISSVNISVDGGDPSAMAAGSLYKNGEESIYSDSYLYYNSTQILSDGTHSVTISAKDDAGNVSGTLASYTLNIDTTAPKYTLYTDEEDESKTYAVKASKSLLTAADVAALGTNPFTLKVKPTDVNGNVAVSGISQFKLYDGNTEIPAADYTVEPAAVSGIYASGVEYTFTLNASAVNQTGNHNFYVETIDGAGNSVKDSVSVSIDTTAPTLSVNDPSPYVTVSGARKFNGIVTISGRANDETELGTINALSYEILHADGTSFSPAKTGSVNLEGGKSSDFSFTIDTTTLTGDGATGTYKVKIIAKDTVQNTADNSDSLIELNVDQTTDKPVVKLSNGNVKVTSEAQISSTAVTSETASENRGNLYGMGNDSIFASATDDDGIASVVLYVNETEIKKVSDNTKPYFDLGTGTPTSYAMEINLKEVLSQIAGAGNEIAGTYTLAIEVTDIANATTISNKTYTTNTDSVNGVYFAYDDDLPVINVTKINSNNYTDGMWASPEASIYITASDSSSSDGHTNLTVTNETIQWWDSNENSYVPGTRETDESTAASWDSASSSWKYSSKNIDKIYKRKFTVTDKYGRSSNKEISYSVDTVAPVFYPANIALFGSSTSIDNSVTAANGVVIATSSEYWFNSDAVKVIGRGSSGAQALVEEHPESVTVTVGTTDYPVNPGEYNKFSTTISFEDGVNTVKFNAVDKADLHATEVTTTVKVDTTAPTDVTGALKKADGSTAVSDNSIINDTVLKLSVTAKDTTSGVKTIYVGKTPGFPKTEAIKSEVLTSANATADGYSGIITLNVGDSTSGNKEYLADGTYSLYIRVEDLAGNITDGSTAVASFTVDRTAPAVTITTPVRSTVIDNTWTISGTVTDNNFVESGSLPELWVYKNSTWVKIDTTDGYGTSSIVSNSAVRSGNDWHITLDSTKINAASGSTTDAFLAVRITDAAGNVTALPTGTPSTASETFYYLTVDQDNDRPVIKFTEVTGDGSTTANTYLVKYATYIKGTVSDGDGNGLSDTTFKVSPTAITTSEAWASFTNETTGTALTNGKVERKASGDFTYTPANGDDGTHTVYFYYKDKAGKEFWTGHSNPLNRPFVIWADTEVNVDNNTVITYRTDKNRPEFDAIVCGLGSTKAEAEADAVKKMYGTGGHSDEMATVTVAGGLSRKFIAFAVKASDANGIKQVTYKNPTKTSGAADETVALTATSKKGWNTENNTVVTAVETETDTIKNVEAYFFEGIDVSSICPAEGSPTEKSVVISVQDTSELDNDKPKTMQFTCIGPEISVDAPLPTDTVSAGTKAKLSGIVTSAATGITNADLKFIYVNNKVYDALDSAGASGRSDTTTTGYTFPSTVSYGGKSGTEAKIAYIKAQASSHTEGHPIVKTVSDMTDGTASKFNWDITTTFPSEDTGAPEICYVPHTTDGKYTLPLWILATDTLGNETLLEYNVTYNPFGDRPVAQITYPEKKVEKDSATNTNVTRDYAVISGNIRVSGAATDNISVDSVYLQVDADNDGDFDADDAEYLISKHYTVYATSAAGITGAVEITGGNFDADSGFWGIKTTGSASWYISLNAENEFQTDATKVKKAGTTEVNYYNIKVRAVALDNNKKLGAWSDALVIHIDPNAPKIGKNVAAYVLDSANNKHNYSADMYVKGETYLCVSVQHQGGITNISYKESDDQSTISMAADTKLVDNSAIVTGKSDITGSLITDWTDHAADLAATGAVTSDKGYLLKIPLNTNSGDGSRAVKISATCSNNGVALTSEDIFTFNYDNTAPEIKEVYVNENTVWEEGSSVALQNSNYKLAIKNDVQDDKAGFNFALWYFYRDDRTATDTQIAANGLNRRVYDPSIKYGSDYATSHAREDVSGSDGAISTGFTKQTVSGLPVYGKTITVTRTEGSLTLPAVDKHVTNGSAVLINGEWLLLSGSTDNLTFNLSGTVPDSVTSAFFPYAKVTAYNTGLENAENWNENGGTISQDDGDGIIESVTKAGTTSTWSAAFHGDYIPDGKVTMVLVAFDKSGNSSAISRTGKVQNNAPRLSKLNLATDLNGDGTFSDAEFETYNLLEKEGDYQSDYDLATAGYGKTEIETARPAFIVKDTLGVVPEFTGGNGDIALVYKLNDTTGKTGSSRDVTTANGGGKLSTTATAATGAYTSGNTVFTSGNHNWFYKMTNAQVTGNETPAESDDGTGKHISFTFWDSTDECQQGTDSQSCYVQLTDLTVDVTDGVAPKVVINPFYWSSSTVNSLFNNSKENGHIELSGDLPTATFNVTNTATSGEYDNDPKVSGKITFTGTAYDEHTLGSLAFTLKNSSGTALTGFSNISMATFSASNTANGGWSAVSGNSGSALASGGKYEWTISQDKSGSELKAGYYDDTYYQNQKGHKIFWTISIDSAQIPNVAQNDITLTVTATDKAGTSSGSAVTAPNTTDGYVVTDGTTNVPSYKVDVVPYITGVETSVSSFLSKDYTRSAVGDYPIKLSDSTGETIKVSGFNLNPTNTATDTNTVKSDVRLSNNKTALDGTTKKGTGLVVAAGTGNDAGKWLVTMSATGNGYLTFFTNDIPSLNNVDSNAEYNQEESLIHASLNNDRKFTLWNFTSLRTNTSAPKSNGATYPSMAMNGDTPQFAYVNNVEGYGLAEFWNGTKETKIYENWDLFTYTALALNSSGNRAALYDINVVQGGTGYASDSGGIMTNFFNNPADSAWGSTCYYFRNNNVWLDGLYKDGVTAVLGRYQYPTIKMVGDESISHVFYSVYDSLEDRVVFRYFTVGTSNTLISNATAITSENSKVYMNKNQLNQVAVGGSWPNYTSTNNDNNKRFSNYGNYAGTSTTPQAFATGSTVGLYTATAGVPVTTNNAGNVTAARGVLVYYAGTEMYYTYATNDANTTWSDPVVLDSNCEASFISMVVDSDKHVHIAYQNNIAGDVKYIYIPTYSAPATRKTVTVDSYLTVGDKLTLDVIGSTPYIGYKGLGNTAKVAWYVANNGVPAVATLTDGINSDEKFTGSWNVEIIPNRIVDSDTNRFNVGVGRSNGRPVIGYSNNQSGSKGIEYLTRTADLED